jgi:anti-sigma regulatory factor (Ser/Thr protein kinase)
MMKKLPGVLCRYGKMPNPSRPIHISAIAQWHWIVPTDPRAIESTVQNVESVIGQLSFSRARFSNFIIAVSELIQNAFLHAPAGTETSVEVSILYLPEVGVYVGVSDALGPIPAAVFKHDLQHMDTMAEHGRGIPIMRTFSSLLVYTKDGDWKEIILGLSAE